LFAEHPLTGDKVAIRYADYVLPDYATGCVMMVPAHDERDLEFARKFGIEVKQVIAPDIVLSDSNAPRDEVETLERQVIDAVIENND